MAAERPGPKAVKNEQATNLVENERNAFISPDSGSGGSKSEGVLAPEKTPTFTGLAEKLIKTSPQEPSTQMDIEHVLGQYMDQLSNLGTEYGQEMSFLKPYLQAGQTGGLTDPAAPYTGPGAAAVNSTTAALQGAEQNTAKALENMPTPGFGAADQLTQEYANSIATQQPIQAALGYQKYLETYGGLAPTAQSAYMKDIYKAIGAGGGSGGLPTPNQAAAGANANAVPTVLTPSSSGTGTGGTTG